MALTSETRTRLIRALADLKVFGRPGELRELVEASVEALPRGKNFVRSFDFNGDGLALARRLVLDAHKSGSPPGQCLEHLLMQVLELNLSDPQLWDVTAALHELRSDKQEIPGADAPTTPAPSEAAQGPFAMVSFSHDNLGEVEDMVKALRARGARVVWDRDTTPETDIPVWVWATYQHADWIVIACSEAYDRSVRRLLQEPKGAPPRGKGVAQEARFMASEHIHHGPARFVPVLLPGARADHIPLVAQGPLRFTLPEAYDALAQHLQRRGPRAQPSVSSGSTSQGEEAGGLGAEGLPPFDPTASRDPTAGPAPNAAPVATDGLASSSSEAALLRVRKTHIAEWQREPKRRHERFIELELEPQGDEGPGARRTFTSLQTLVTQVAESSVLLVGAPGAGKTTLLRHVCAELSELDQTSKGETRRIPFFAALNRYPKSTSPGLGLWLEETFERTHPGLGPLDAALLEGRVWMLLDGLNEMAYGDTPTARFDALRDYLHVLPPNNRVVVTCREQDVAGVLDETARAAVKPLSHDSVRAFLKKYAPAKAEAAWRDLREQDLIELYQNPYRLSLLVDELLENGSIPSDRAALFSTLVLRTLRHNLAHADAAAWLQPLLGETAQRCIARNQLPAAYTKNAQGPLLVALGALAFSWQVAGPGQHRWWDREEAIDRLDPKDGERAERLLSAARRLLVFEEAEGEDQVRFPHQQIQEYFAARHWVRTLDGRAFDQANKGERVGDAKLGRALVEVVAELKPSARLVERPATGWEETAVMAVALAKDPAFVQRLSASDLVSAGRGVLGTDRSSPEMKSAMRARLAAFLQDPKVELRARIDAGMILDTPEPLGFVRARSEEGVEYLLSPTGTIRAGRYEVGSDARDAGAYKDEHPKHAYTLKEDLEVSRFPVTNAEYALFMDAGGYENEAWWPEGENRAWWKGEREDTQAEDQARVLRGWSDAVFEEQAERNAWGEEFAKALWKLRAGSMEEAVAYFTPAEHPSRQKRPEWWLDSAFNRPLQPVVGLSVFEAEAYVLWLSAVAGRPACLLPEKAWEVAARGRKRRVWSYGNEEDVLAANTFALRLRQPSPVGAFAPKQTPEGIQELSGNVWEWTSSSWAADHKPTTEKETRHRVVRGGSWVSPMLGARGACRLRFPLDVRDNFLGFRVCFPSPQSDP